MQFLSSAAYFFAQDSGDGGESAGRQGNLLEVFEAGIGRDLGAHLAPVTHSPISGQMSSHGAGVSVLLRKEFVEKMDLAWVCSLCSAVCTGLALSLWQECR